VKQFVRPLKEVAFDWYTGLASEFIDSREQMGSELSNCFCNTHHVVSII